MQTGTIVRRIAGQIPPAAYMERLFAANPKGWGAAMVDGGKLMLNSMDSGMTMELFEGTIKEFPDTDISFYFCNATDALSIKDMSPYILLQKPLGNNEFEPTLVAFIEGNFAGSEQAGSSHPPEYHLVTDHLLPKFESLYEMVDEDIDKLMEQLKKPHFKKELLLTSVARGTITLVASNGVSITFDQNDLSASYPWGWVSNTHGYAEGKAKEPDAQPKKPSIFSKSNVTPAAAAKDDPKPVTASGEAVKLDIPRGYSVKKWAPQASYSRKERQNAYKMRLGYKPVGWEENIEVNIAYNDKNKPMTFAEVKQMGIKGAGLMQAISSGKTNPAHAQDLETDHIPEPVTQVKSGEGKVTAEILPIMGPKSREGVNDIRRKDGYKAIISENADVISDPKQVENFETKFADFAKQMGAESMEEFAKWDFPMYLDLCRNDPPAAAVMLITFRNSWLKAILKKGETSVETVAAPAKKPSIFAKTG